MEKGSDTFPGEADLARLNRRQFGLFGMATLGAMAAGGTMPALARDADELVVAYGAIGAARHPWQTVLVVDFDILNLIFDPLMTLDEKGNIIPVLAESWEQVSPTVIRVKLREGARFHTGEDVTAEDVKYSIEMSLDDKAILGFYYKSWLEKVQIVDKRTVDIISKGPARLAPRIVAYISFVMPAGTKIENYTKPVGSGPYRFVEFVPNNRIVLERNPAWWGKAPRFRTITIRQIPEPSTRVAALVAGEIDYAENVPVEDIPTVKNAKRDVVTAATNRIMYFGFNRTGKTPFENPLVRKAVNHAIDKAGIRAAIYSDMGAPADSVIPPGIQYRTDKLEPYAYDPAKAKALLAQAGFANGFEMTLAGPNNRYLRDRETCEIVASQLQQIGLKVNLKLFDWATYTAELRTDRDAGTGKYGMWLWAWGTNPPDPEPSFGSLLTGSAYNMAGFANPKMMDLLAQSRVTSNDAELVKIFTELQKLVWEDEAQMVGMLYLPQIVGIGGRLKGLKLRQDEYTRWATL